MAVADDIALIKRQELELVLPVFDETVAYAIGTLVRERALAEGLSLVVDLRSWDRQMFFSATAGTSADNAEWVRRKINTVRRYQRASYRMVLERGEAPFPPQVGADPCRLCHRRRRFSAARAGRRHYRLPDHFGPAGTRGSQGGRRRRSAIICASIAAPIRCLPHSADIACKHRPAGR